MYFCFNKIVCRLLNLHFYSDPPGLFVSWLSDFSKSLQSSCSKRSTISSIGSSFASNPAGKPKICVFLFLFNCFIIPCRFHLKYPLILGIFPHSIESHWLNLWHCLDFICYKFELAGLVILDLRVDIGTVRLTSRKYFCPKCCCLLL